MDRAKFLKISSIATVGTCCGLVSTLSSCTNVFYVPFKQENQESVQVQISDLADHKFAVVEIPGIQGGVYLIQHEEEFKAYSMLCTHKQCVLTPAGDMLICPCHGSEFTNQGKVLNPPANKNLPEYRTSQDDTHVTIYFT